jgi:predicted HicB family RNase H-like nuclease
LLAQSGKVASHPPAQAPCRPKEENLQDSRDCTQDVQTATVCRSYKASVDDYLAFCRKQGEEPDEPRSGNAGQTARRVFVV